MARHSRMNMEWTLASCRTPRNTRKMVEEAFHRPNSGSNRISKPKNKKNGKPLKNVEIKGSWDHTGDDSSQLAEGEGNDSEDGSEDSSDKPYVKGPALTSRGHLKGKKGSKNQQNSKNKKTGSAGPMNQFSRQKASMGRHRDQTADDTPTKARHGGSLYAQRQRDNTYSSLDSDLSDTSSFTMDLELDADETALNEYNMMISDTEESDVDDDDEISSDDLDGEDISGDEMDDIDDDDQSILDEETEYIVGLPPTSDDGFLGVPIEHIPNSPSAISEDSDDELEDIYMDMDDPVVQKIMNHSYTICDDDNDNSDDMLEPYFSDEATEESDDYDSDATVDDEPEEEEEQEETKESTPKPKSVSPAADRRPDQPSSTSTPAKSYMPPRTGFFKANPNRLLCLVESISGVNRVLVMTVDEYYGKADSSSNTTVTTPGPKASEELFAYLSSCSQYNGSIPSEDQLSISSFNKNFVLGSDWDDSSVIDASFFPQWTDYIVENLDTKSEDATSTSVETMSFMDEERRGSEASAIPEFVVPVTAFRANQNNALSRTSNTISGIHSSGIKKNAPRKDSSLTPSQRRKSDATQNGRQKTPTPPIPFPVPLEPLFADSLSVNPAA